MSREDAILGNFHQPTTDLHPPESIGNQQIFEGGRQVGSLEYIPTPDGTLNIQVNNTSGDNVFDLSQ